MVQLFFIVVAQLLAPIGVIAWLFAGRSATRSVWLARAVLGAGIVGLAAVAGVWILPPWPTPYLYVALLAVGAWIAWRRTASDAWWRRTRARSGLALIVTAAAAIAVWGLVSYALTGWMRPSSDLVDLSFPLREGTYYIANGGSNELINPHMATLRSNVRTFRGQSYGLDIIGIGPFGTNADGFLPAEPERYHIFGDAVYAPCAGEVVRAVDGLEDLPVPQTDPRNPAGNHIVVRCRGYDVMLAHLMLGSVSVVRGDLVRPAGQPIARVGNSGNTNEPHLHIHAQRQATTDEFMNAAPVPMVFDGHYLVRNQRVRPRSEPH